MRQILLIIDVQPTFSPPPWLLRGIETLASRIPAVATVERHDERVTPFARQLGWTPATDDHSLVQAGRVFIKHGYAPPPSLIEYLKDQAPQRVLVCGIQADTCVLAAGFALFDAGLMPTLLRDLTVGSSLDRSGQLGVRLWQHHFGHTTTSVEVLQALDGPPPAPQAQ